VAPAPKLIKPLNLEGLRAKSFLVYDIDSNSQLSGQNETFALPIASLTKLMTGYVVYQHLTLSLETITVAANDPLDISPVLGVQVGDHIKAIDLFDSMLIGSANDAAQTLGNYVGRKLNLPFKDLMNQEAVALGMEDSHFSNPVGFDSETNYSTAADLKLLVNAVQQYQAFALVGRERSYSFTSADGNKYYVKATNKLLAGDPEISAIKTGFTDEAQGAMITEINHDGHKFIIIVLGSADREGDTVRLKQAIINSYRWP
jgi:D-alanyl-D-alanine carboxypeptidase